MLFDKIEIKFEDIHFDLFHIIQPNSSEVQWILQIISHYNRIVLQMGYRIHHIS